MLLPPIYLYRLFSTALSTVLSVIDQETTLQLLHSNKAASQRLGYLLLQAVPPENRFLKLPNVTLTPHIAGASVKTVSYAAGLAAEEVRRYLAGEPALNRC